MNASAAYQSSDEPDYGEPLSSVGSLLGEISGDISTLMRQEVELAKTELRQSATRASKGAGMLGGAAFVALLGLIFLFHTLAYVLDIWLPLWAGYLITTVLLFVVAAVLGLLGRKALTTAKPKPEKAIAEAQQTIAAIKPGH